MKENPLLKHHGKFTAIDSKIKKHPIIGFDTEDDSKGTPLLFAFYGDFPGKKYVTRHWEEALDFIYKLEKTSILVAHNLEYDIANLFKQDDYLMVDTMLYSSTLLKVTMYGTSHYFINSLCFFRGTLKKMAEFVGLKKYEGDALSEKYVIRDAEIAYTFMSKFQDKLVDELGVNLGITIGQMAMQTYRRNYMLAPVQITYNSPNCLRAYYGGRVEIFYKGSIENVHVCDINSCYPYVMRDRHYPDTSRIEPSTIDTHEFGIGKFKVHVPEDTFLPVLPFKSENGKLFFPVGTFTGWWTYQEMRYAIRHGAKIIKEYQGEGTNNSCRPFDDFIDTFYNLRIGSKKVLKTNPKDPQANFDSIFYKLWQNNLYGKWCQWRAGNTLTRDKWSDYQLEKWRAHPDFVEKKIGVFYSYTVPKLEPPKTANFMWGIYVTSYSRMYLHEGMYRLHRDGHKILYCDTDSIMFSPGSDNIDLPFSNKLGDWDLEKFDLGVFRQAKGYLLCNKKGKDYEIEKVASKGVPTHLAYDFIIDGMAMVTKPMRLKEALIRASADINQDDKEFLEEMGENVWYDVRKEMRSVYIKRSGKRGVTRAVNVSEIGELEKGQRGKTYVSIKDVLARDGITIKKPDSKRAFVNTVIPPGYFEGLRKGISVPSLFVSQKVFYLREEQTIELSKGQIWFAGDILQLSKTGAGKRIYKIRLTNFKGKKVPVNMWAAIRPNFLACFGLSENLIDKFIEAKIINNYLHKTGLSLKLKLKDSNYKGQFEPEESENEELSQQELENLMAFDWSSLQCLKQQT